MKRSLGSVDQIKYNLRHSRPVVSALSSNLQFCHFVTIISKPALTSLLHLYLMIRLFKRSDFQKNLNLSQHNRIIIPQQSSLPLVTWESNVDLPEIFDSQVCVVPIPVGSPDCGCVSFYKKVFSSKFVNVSLS